MDGRALLQNYRQRGTAEKDFGEWNQALDLSLSSTPRPKSRYRRNEFERPYTKPDTFAANEVRLLLSLIAAGEPSECSQLHLMHAAAALLDCEVTACMSRESFLRLVLKSAESSGPHLHTSNVRCSERDRGCP